MVKNTEKEILLPNGPGGARKWRGVELIGRTIDIGKAEVYDELFDCRLVDCHIRIFRGARGVDFFRCTLESCTIDAKKELKNLHFALTTLRNCVFLGHYSGCRFGNYEEADPYEVVDCDFSRVKKFHLCDFMSGVRVNSLVLPPWPHVTVTQLARTRACWLALPLPDALRTLQRVIGEEGAPGQAVTFYLPERCADYAHLRSLFATQDYIQLNDPGA